MKQAAYTGPKSNTREFQRCFHALTKDCAVGEQITLWGCNLFLNGSGGLVTGLKISPEAFEFTKTRHGLATANTRVAHCGHWSASEGEAKALVVEFLREALADYTNMRNGRARHLKKLEKADAETAFPTVEQAIAMNAELFYATNTLQLANQNISTLERLIQHFQ